MQTKFAIRRLHAEFAGLTVTIFVLGVRAETSVFLLMLLDFVDDAILSLLLLKERSTVLFGLLCHLIFIEESVNLITRLID